MPTSYLLVYFSLFPICFTFIKHHATPIFDLFLFQCPQRNHPVKQLIQVDTGLRLENNKSRRIFNFCFLNKGLRQSPNISQFLVILDQLLVNNFFNKRSEYLKYLQMHSRFSINQYHTLVRYCCHVDWAPV